VETQQAAPARLERDRPRRRVVKRQRTAGKIEPVKMALFRAIRGGSFNLAPLSFLALHFSYTTCCVSQEIMLQYNRLVGNNHKEKNHGSLQNCEKGGEESSRQEETR
jgi:hypothetical protein